jgi:peptide/nickel transport system substrate-binding protein
MLRREAKTNTSRTPGQRFGRRGFIRGAAVSAAGLSAMASFGCSSDDDSAEVPSLLAIADISLLSGLTEIDPNVTTVPGSATSHIFDSIVHLDVDYKLRPGIASAWEQADAMTWSLKVRPDATFHDGTKVTAEDVKYTLERIVSTTNNFPQRVYFDPFISSVETQGDQVLLKMKSPNAVMPNRLNLGKVVSRAFVEAVGQDGLRSNPVGSGPYKFDSWTPDQQMDLVALPSHWRGKPTFPKVRFQRVTEEATRVNLIQTDAVHAANGMPPEQLDAMAAQGLKVESFVSAGLIFIQPNAKEPPFNDKRVRQAMALIIDGPLIKQGVYRGRTEIMASAAAPPSNGYDASIKPYEKDHAEARRLLQAAGVGTSFSTELTAASAGGSFVRVPEYVQAVGQQLKEFGLNVAVNLTAQFGPNYLTGTLKGLHSFNCGDILGDISHCTQLIFRNRALYYSNADLAALIEKMDATLNAQERKTIQSQVLKFIHDEYAWVFIRADHQSFAMKPALTVKSRPDGYIDMLESTWS